MMLNGNLFVSGSIHQDFYESLSIAVKSSCSVPRWTKNTVDQILIEGDAIYLKAVEQQTITDTV